MPGSLTRAAWDDVERQILTAVQTPQTIREVIAVTGLSGDTVKAQLDTLRGVGHVIDTVGGGVRYQLTLTGRRRLIALTGAAEHDADAA